MASSFIKGLREKLSILAGDWLIMQPDAEEDTAYKIKKSNVKSDATEPSTWYVHKAPKGSNSNVGSDKFPFETIEKAHATAVDGDVIILLGFDNTYSESFTVTKKLTIKSLIDNGRLQERNLLTGSWLISTTKTINFEGVNVSLSLFTDQTDYTIVCKNSVFHPRNSSGFKMRVELYDSDFTLSSTITIFSIIWIGGLGKDAGSGALSIGSVFQFYTIVSLFNITSGLESASTNKLYGSTITANLTITGDLDQENSTVKGALSVSGSITGGSRFAGQVTVHGKVVTFTATPTFDFDDGNVQEMILTSNVTSLTLSNKLNAGNYLIYLIQDGTGGHTLPTPDSSWGDPTDNSVDPSNFLTGANDRNLINVAVSPSGFTEYSIETHNI